MLNSSQSKPTPGKAQSSLFTYFGKHKAAASQPAEAQQSSLPVSTVLPSPPTSHLSLGKTIRVPPLITRADVSRLSSQRSQSHASSGYSTQSQPSRDSEQRDIVMADATSDDINPLRQQSEQRTPASLRRSFGCVVVGESDEDDTPQSKRSNHSTSSTIRRNRSFIINDDDCGPESLGWGDDDDTAADLSLSSPTTKAKTQLQRHNMTKETPVPPKKVPSSSALMFIAEERRKERGTKFAVANKDTYAWLQDIRDADGHKPSDTDYNSRTLYIPPNAWSTFTDFERQFWEIKCRYFDTVVFFKKGKFYELYERDADIGHQQFDLRLSHGGRAAMRMVGVPEGAFEEWASKFIAKGHKVARVDQIETATGKAMREKAGNKVDKVIRRELTAVLTAGTLVDGRLITSDLSTYCMSLKEFCTNEGLAPRFAVCFVDTSTAEFHFALFDDDLSRTKLETIFVQIRPRELVTEKGGLTAKTRKLIKSTLFEPLWNMLVPGKEFWGYQRTVDELDIAKYFNNSKNGVSSTTWPSVLERHRNDELFMSCFGGLVSYLRSIKLDQSLLSLQNFHLFDPLHQTTSLLLDGQTLTNLSVFANDIGTDEGTLVVLLNRCYTPFGKRLFRRWLCHPLRIQRDIEDRLDAVEDLLQLNELREDIDKSLRKCPDMERIVSRIHMGTCRLKEMLLVLKALQDGVDLIARIKMNCTSDKGRDSNSIKSTQLRRLVETFPDLTILLNFFATAFDHTEALEQGNIVPKPGVDDEYDGLMAQFEQIQTDYDSYLQETKRTLRTTAVQYKDIGKELKQIEVAVHVVVPREWKKMSGTKALSRYHTSVITRMNQKWAELMETKTLMLGESTKRMYKRFDEHYSVWNGAVKVLAELDALMSLAKSSLAMGEPICRPKFMTGVRESMLELQDMRHPCMALSSKGDFIPNDTRLGGNEPEDANVMLLTGPNMGGKSTLLRQTCIAVILAQLGCYVPARSCRMTVVDRIFTRIGANDNILAGQSTFMVEMSETAKILREATPRSLVILDELGRGTSTFDGYAIAFAVLHDLVTRVRCLGLFSTHYGMLTQEYAYHGCVENWHMGCLVDEIKKEVTFLYQLRRGACPKSYGMNVANMAGLSHQIVDRAEHIAREFEGQRLARDGVTNDTGSLGRLLRHADFAQVVGAGTEAGIARAVWRAQR